MDMQSQRRLLRSQISGRGEMVASGRDRPNVNATKVKMMRFRNKFLVKIIGARYYTDENARDTVGHGSHTASTAAGNLVKQASFFGVAEGNARGAVPLSRIAVYKACSLSGCRSDFTLSAFDDAISDGVDILSVSLGSNIPRIFEQDVIAIGGFHAMLRGILTSNSAGNSGPSPATTSSTAPWLFSVAASTTDRLIIDKVVLGDNTTLTVQGKILLCENNTTPGVELSLNVTGAILTKYEGDVPRVSFIPSSRLNLNDIATVFSYVTTAKNPEATILKSESIVDASAPEPDIAAPGVDILAAWPTSISPTGSSLDTRSVKYNIISGTSMSCPHGSGAAAYVKTFHLDWSPAAIKSALMTTAVPMNATRNADAEFSYGSGFINPVKALNPGLVYDASVDDYIKMLCSIGYTSDKIKVITGKISSCPSKYNGTAMDLNYPSMAMTNSTKEAVFTRTVTNVGVANSTYRATVASPSYVIVSVEPKVLSFKSLNEKQSFIVKVSLKDPPGEVLVASASLVWSDGIHSVRSPIAASFRNI
ncbi:hypothetical protein Syun_000416 [Stephania yunnanensis]|uniref:Cucumisin n=1 Tax=Stephania yunnanensis TaxID=152371 RepID=A0AAP0LC36_9MAGN